MQNHCSYTADCPVLPHLNISLQGNSTSCQRSLLGATSYTNTRPGSERPQAASSYKAAKHLKYVSFMVVLFVYFLPDNMKNRLNLLSFLTLEISGQCSPSPSRNEGIDLCFPFSSTITYCSSEIAHMSTCLHTAREQVLCTLATCFLIYACTNKARLTVRIP